MTIKSEDFAQAANEWDLETLYNDLASAKTKNLTPVEKLHLRGLLCGYSPAEIATKLDKNPKGVESELCKKLYVYVKNLVDKSGEKVENWRNIIDWLKEAGYKLPLSPQYHINDSFSHDTWFKIGSISIEKDKIMILGFCIHGNRNDQPLEKSQDNTNNQHPIIIDKNFDIKEHTISSQLN